VRTLKQNSNSKTFLSAQLVNAYEGKAGMVYLRYINTLSFLSFPFLYYVGLYAAYCELPSGLVCLSVN